MDNLTNILKRNQIDFLGTIIFHLIAKLGGFYYWSDTI